MSALSNSAARLSGSRPAVRFWRTILFLWGAQWILSAVFRQLELFGAPSLLVPLSFWAAAAATLVCLPLLRRKPAALPATSPSPAAARLRLAGKPTSVSIAAVLLLFAALLPFFVPAAYLLEFYRSTALAAFYLILGARFSRRFTAFAVWLMLLMLAVLLLYLGFAPFILGILGGCSLIACALVINL